MKKYIAISALFLANAEVLSWLALLTLVVMAVIDFAKAAEREKNDNKNNSCADSSVFVHGDILF